MSAMATIRAKLGRIESQLDEIEREVAAEVGKPKASPKAEPKKAPAKAKAEPKKAPKAEPKAPKDEPKDETPAEPVIAPFNKSFRLEAELQPEGLVGKKSPRAKFQAEGLKLKGAEGAFGKVYAYLPVGKEIPKTLVASFAGESRGSKAIFQAETEDGIAVYVYLPVRHLKSNKLDLAMNEDAEGVLQLVATKHRNGETPKPEASETEPEAPKADQPEPKKAPAKKKRTRKTA